MSQGLEAIDLDIEEAQRWIDDVMQEAAWDDRRKAYVALRTVLQAIRDRLVVSEAIAFGAALPVLIRGVFFEGWRPDDQAQRVFSRRDFLRAVQRRMSASGEREDAEKAAQAVIRVLARNLRPPVAA